MIADIISAEVRKRKLFCGINLVPDKKGKKIVVEVYRADNEEHAERGLDNKNCIMILNEKDARTLLTGLEEWLGKTKTRPKRKDKPDIKVVRESRTKPKKKESTDAKLLRKVMEIGKPKGKKK